MNRVLRSLLHIFFVMVLTITSLGVLGQKKNTSQLSPEDVKHFMKQSEQLIKFMEFTFNTLGDPNVSTREKDIIINQSYLKFFATNKVQIEDDLVEGRFTVTNKDVQAYLKDIDFFFHKVVFTFTIESLTYNVNENGQVYFHATTTRNLNGISSEKDTIFNNLTRYIEINLDRESRDLKIASIYTSKLSEREDMRNWWSGLDAAWRNYFAKNVTIANEYPLKNVLGFADNWLLIERHKVAVMENFVMESRRNDTVKTNATQIYQEISRIWKTETVDISMLPGFNDASPLSKLTDLRVLNIGGSFIADLTPIRNLTRLESLIISETSVNQLDPLRFAINLKNLDASKTDLRSLDMIPTFSGLEKLNVSNTKISTLEPLRNLTKLQDLRIGNTRVNNLSPLSQLFSLVVLDISGTQVTDLSAIGKLQNLERLHADYTKVSNLSPLTNLQKLQFLFADGTEITSIEPLNGLPELKRIYCDRTLITKEQANKFVLDNPGVLVIYESQTLNTWWALLSQAWKDVFIEIVTLSEPPTREELHQISNLTHLNISNNNQIFNLAPLQQLTGLRTLLASNTNILSIENLKDNIDLAELDISSTNVRDISVLSELRMLETLNISNTPVESIAPLHSVSKLKHLDLDKTRINSVAVLGSLKNLEIVICDGIELKMSEVTAIYAGNPNVTVVYQTEALNSWWNSLPLMWKNIFEKHILIENPPTRFQLQKLVDLKELNISNTRGLADIEPLRQFHRLQILKMNDSQINNIKPLENLIYLRELHCSNNPISDLKPLKNLSQLTTLDCSNTLVRRLDPLSNLTNLEILNLSGTPVSALRPLGNLSSLRQLDCSNTRVISLKPLEKLTGLELLRCYNTRVLQYFVNRFRKAVPDCEIVHY